MIYERDKIPAKIKGEKKPIFRLCVGALTWQDLVISRSFRVSVKTAAKKEADSENNYSQRVHLSTAQQDGGAQHASGVSR